MWMRGHKKRAFPFVEKPQGRCQRQGRIYPLNYRRKSGGFAELFLERIINFLFRLWRLIRAAVIWHEEARWSPLIVIMIDFPKNIKNQRQGQKEKAWQREKRNYGLWLLRLDAGCVTLFDQNTMQRSVGVHSCCDSPYISRAFSTLMGNAKRMVCMGRKRPLTYRRKRGGFAELFFERFSDLILL